MGVTPSVSLTLDSSLTEGAKDEELLLVNVSEKAINHRYKEAMPPQYAPICRSRGFCGKVRWRALKCCDLRAIEENRMRSASEHWVFLSLTTFSFISLKEKV